MICHNAANHKYYCDGVEITAEEYTDEMEAIQAKAAWINRIYNGLADIGDAPAEWREAIAQCVADRQAQADDDPELTAEEALDIIVGGAV